MAKAIKVDTKKQSWSDMSTGSRIAIVALGMAQVGLAAYAGADLSHRPKSEVRGSKFLWTLVLPINWIGPGAYLILGRKRGVQAD